MKAKDLEVVYRDINDIYPNENNAKQHPQAQIDKIAQSIKEFGFNNPIAVDEHNMIIAGHGRWFAARQLGKKRIPTVSLTHMSEQEKRAYILADNKLNMITGFDAEKLEEEIRILMQEYDSLEHIGFSASELDNILGGFGPAGPGGMTEFTQEQKIVKLAPGKAEDLNKAKKPPKDTFTDPGDQYQIGNHRLICGDSTNLDLVDILMDKKPAGMVFTDPPYNIAYGSGKPMIKSSPKFKDRSIENDDMKAVDWEIFVQDFMVSLLTYCDGNIYICMSDPEMSGVTQSFIDNGGRFCSYVIWAKDNFVLRPEEYHKQHELILYGWKKNIKGRVQIEDRTQSTLWTIPRPKSSKTHPHMKPVELVQRAIVNSSKVGFTVLDLFGGSGSTMVACEMTNRKARLMEKDPRHCDSIICRMFDMFPSLPITKNGKAFKPPSTDFDVEEDGEN